MNLRDIFDLLRLELLGGLRERSIVINSILVPVLLYPAIIFAMLTLMTFVDAQTERFESRVEVVGEGPATQEVIERLAARDNVTVTQIEAGSETASSATARLELGSIDALLEVRPAGERASPDRIANDADFALTVVTSRDRSSTAAARVRSAIEEHRRERIDHEARTRGVPADQWQVFSIEENNLATGRQMGAFVLSLLIPLTLTVMIAAGCFYPAVGATAGERERGTWETTLSLATARSNVVVAKYLYVVVFGCLAGFLNVVALLVSARGILAGMTRDAPVEVSLPLSTLPVLLVCSVLLATMLAAGMMIFASFARTFKEGQAMVTPFYILSIVPVMAMVDEGLRLTEKTALVPFLNTALLMRDAFQGQVAAVPVLITLVVSAVVVALLLFIASRILAYEDILTGTYDGKFTQFIRQRLFAKGA